MVTGRLTIRIDESDAGRRLDAVVASRAGVSRGRAAEMIEHGTVTVGGGSQPKSYRVGVGDVIEALPLPEVVPSGPLPSFGVVWEDDDLLIVDKPPGVVVHPASGVREPTLVDAIAATGRPLAPRGGIGRPGVVHRLDRDVSGLLLVAKTDRAHERLVEDLKARRIRREYLACVAAAPEVDRGTIDAPVGRHPRHRTRMAVLPSGRSAVTHFRTLERLGAEAALLEVRLETGRTHQIRTHLESIGHPILGDAAYGRDSRLAREIGLDRPFLHAFRLALEHPVTAEPLDVRSPLPHDLEQALGRLRER